MGPPSARTAPAATPGTINSFCNGPDSDRDAVNADLNLPWRNGRTEGVNTRTQKNMQQMHCRAGFDLLGHRTAAPNAL